MWTVNDKKLGECEVEVSIDSGSIVDCFLESGYSLTLNRDLSEEELDYLWNEGAGIKLQDQLYAEGYCRNHN